MRHLARLTEKLEIDSFLRQRFENLTHGWNERFQKTGKVWSSDHMDSDDEVLE